jgi:hypothetical protein
MERLVAKKDFKTEKKEKKEIISLVDILKRHCNCCASLQKIIGVTINNEIIVQDSIFTQNISSSIYLGTCT